MENRRFPRIPARNVVLVTPAAPGEGEEELGRTETVGAGGCGFVSEQRFDDGAALEMRIASGPDVITSTTRVVYSRPLDDGRWEVGVEFVDLSAEDRAALDRLLTQPVEGE